MKKHIFLLLCCTVCALRATAQFTPKSVLLEGSLNYSTTFKNKDAPSGTKSPYSFLSGTSVGLFVNRRNELGVGFSFNKERGPRLLAQGLSQSDYSRSFGYSVFWRNYVLLNEKLSYSGGIVCNTSFTKIRRQDFNSGFITITRLRQIGLIYSPSLVYMITSKLGLRGGIGFASLNLSKNKGDEAWFKSLQLNFRPQNINFGIFLLLNQ
jgi:hypothetical protein